MTIINADVSRNFSFISRSSKLAVVQLAVALDRQSVSIVESRIRETALFVTALPAMEEPCAISG